MPRMGEDLSREIRTLSRINVLQRPHPTGPAEGRLFRSEHSRAEVRSRPFGSGTKNKRTSFRMSFCSGSEG